MQPFKSFFKTMKMGENIHNTYRNSTENVQTPEIQ